MRAEERAAIDWLTGLRDPDSGLWWSWQGERGDAYPYEEATAWVALLAAGLRERPEARGLLEAAREGLGVLEGVVTRRGGLGRGGRVYLFDTAVGLAAAGALGGRSGFRRALLGGVRRMVAEGLAVDGGPRAGEEGAGTRWSEAWGCHLMWLAIPLLGAGLRGEAEALVEELEARCGRPGGLLSIHGASDAVYAHAAAYAAEGLVALGRVGRARAVVEALLDAPSASGLVPASPSQAGGAERTDVTAQVLRIAPRCGLPPSDPRLRRARAALQVACHPLGGWRYEAEGTDRSSWSTVFALAAGLCPGAW